ncbi:apolipoprotein N-acyltransferase [Zymomonas mobilis]|uniref:Apolipoprotein N-acyltransferase n=1 Tax=Zymomonas mobilis TaxID=542 RepID=A0A542VZQ4_ZYMMB|nr:apolipoprotein N-acyltransferase [Zymomonas mobilis]TQL16791.1 apolipoprotein N-acyltransferase [Zymomonas mobilis]
MTWIFAFLAGLVAALGLQPYNLWGCSLVAVAGWLALLRQTKKTWQIFAVSWLFAFGFFWLGLDWIATSFTHQAAMPSWLGWVAVPLLSCYLACYIALFTLPIRLLCLSFGRRNGDGLGFQPSEVNEGEGAIFTGRLSSVDDRALVAREKKAESRFSPVFDKSLSQVSLWRLTLALAGCLAWGEWIKSWVLTGFPWSPLGVIWLNMMPIAHSARWIGSYGLSALVVIAAGIVLSLYDIAKLGMVAKLSSFSTFAKPIIPAVMMLLPFVGWCLVDGHDTHWQKSERKPAHVVIVQPNIPQDEKYDLRYKARHDAIFVKLSGKGDAHNPRLILWPEDAVQSYLEEEPLARAALSRLLGENDLLLTGGDALISDSSGRIASVRNSLFAIDAKGDILDRYDKAHLVPFGEYMPLRKWAAYVGLGRLVAGDLEFTEGAQPESLDLVPFGLVGIQICYEIVFSGRVVDRAHRPDFIFNLSNDSWFGRSGPPQHLAQARLRAIEEGLPIARATSTGISAIIDAEGYILSALPENTEGSLSVSMPRALQPTFFARYGNLTSVLFATALLLIALFGRIKLR